MKGKKGVAVIMAMWLLAVLAIIGTTFAYMMRLEPLIARTHRDDMKALYVAQAGIDHGLYILKQDRLQDASAEKRVDHLGETWASGLTDEILYDEETPANIVGYYTITISDESGMTNLNTAPQSQLEGLSDDITSDRAGYIIDYRTTYNSFETIDDLMCVREITQTRFDKIKEIITVHTTDGFINLNTAPYSVLMGIEDGEGGLDSTDVTSIITYREGAYSPYDIPYRDGLGPATEVACAASISEAEAEYLTGEDVYSTSPGIIDGTKRVSVKSQGLFTIISTGKYVSPSGQETVKKIRVVIGRERITTEADGEGLCSGDKIMVCHKPGWPAEQSLCVNPAAVSGHLAHGDYYGPCVEMESEIAYYKEEPED